CETIDADADQSLRVRRELSRPRLQRIDDPACAGWFMANGKERASHLATEKFHDDRAAQSRRVIHLHAVLGIRRPPQLRHDKDRWRRAPAFRGRISGCPAADAEFARRFSE